MLWTYATTTKKQLITDQIRYVLESDQNNSQPTLKMLQQFNMQTSHQNTDRNACRSYRFLGLPVEILRSKFVCFVWHTTQGGGQRCLKAARPVYQYTGGCEPHSLSWPPPSESVSVPSEPVAGQILEGLCDTSVPLALNSSSRRVLRRVPKIPLDNFDNPRGFTHYGAALARILS